MEPTITIQEALEKIQRSSTALQLQEPFFSPFLGKLRHEITEKGTETFTCGTDGKRIIYNTSFVAELDGKELMFVIAHEVLHCLFLHFARRGDRDHRLWNIACDFAVNQSLVDSGIGSFPPSGLYVKGFQRMSAEEIYNFLLNSAEERSFGAGKTLKDLDTLDDHSLFESLTEEDIEILEEQVAESMARGSKLSSEFASSMGRHLGFAEGATPTPWKSLLKASLVAESKTDYSYHRLNRKTSPMGIYLPTLKRDCTLDIVVALDSSGSIFNKALNLFLQEVSNICKDFEGLKVTLFTFDLEVHNAVTYTSENIGEIGEYQVQGGSGTSFEAIFDYLEQEGVVPTKLLIFTDMYPGGGWGDPQYCPTMFVAVDSTTEAPYGETIFISTRDL